MAIIGFILVILIGCWLLVGAYGVAGMEVGFGGQFPLTGIILAAIGFTVIWLAIHFAPFTINFVGG